MYTRSRYDRRSVSASVGTSHSLGQNAVTVGGPGARTLMRPRLSTSSTRSPVQPPTTHWCSRPSARCSPGATPPRPSGSGPRLRRARRARPRGPLRTRQGPPARAEVRARPDRGGRRLRRPRPVFGVGAPADWIAADILRVEHGILVEHRDVIQDEATRVRPADVRRLVPRVPLGGSPGLASTRGNPAATGSSALRSPRPAHRTGRGPDPEPARPIAR